MTAGSLPGRHGPAEHPERPVAQHRPSGASDAEIAALGKMSEVLEVVEHARGLLYGFHRLCGTADQTVQQAVAMLRDAGHGEFADEIDATLVGRDVIDGRWSFQLVEAYDDGYWTVFREVAAQTRRRLGGATRHVSEAEMKHREQRDRDDSGEPSR
jgi:hypothetical protein